MSDGPASRPSAVCGFLDVATIGFSCEVGFSQLVLELNSFQVSQPREGLFPPVGARADFARKRVLFLRDRGPRRLMDDQEDAVQWWRASVRGKGERRSSNSADSALFQEEAEKILGFDHQTVARGGKKLAHRDEYREEPRRAPRKPEEALSSNETLEQSRL